jgi:hypothetical protein
MTDIADCYFTSLTVPNAFFAQVLGSSAWDDATDADKTKALQMATKAIDAIRYSGYKMLSSQARAFPRKYVPSESSSPWGNTISEDPWGYVYDTADVNQDILDACCWEALALLQYYASSANASRQNLRAQGVTSYSIGDLSESYGASSLGGPASYNLKSQEAYNLLELYMDRRADIR